MQYGQQANKEIPSVGADQMHEQAAKIMNNLAI